MDCESHIAPLLDELKYNINLRMHYIGFKQVRVHAYMRRLCLGRGGRSRYYTNLKWSWLRRTVSRAAG